MTSHAVLFRLASAVRPSTLFLWGPINVRVCGLYLVSVSMVTKILMLNEAMPYLEVAICPDVNTLIGIACDARFLPSFTLFFNKGFFLRTTYLVYRLPIGPIATIKKSIESEEPLDLKIRWFD